MQLPVSERGSWWIYRLDSGNRKRHNFFMLAILTFQKTATDSVNHADSGDIKILVQFPWNSIFKLRVKFWNCMGGTHIRGCFVSKIIQGVYLFKLII